MVTTRKLIINRYKSRWRQQVSTLGPVLFNILINNTDSGIKCTPSKFADNTKVNGAADITEGRDIIQRTSTSSKHGSTQTQ